MNPPSNQSINLEELKSKINFNQFLDFVSNRIFFDDHLQYHHQLDLLNRRNTIEAEFIRQLVDFINSVSLSDNERAFILNNISRFSEPLTHVHYSLLAAQTVPVDNDEDDDNDVEVDDDSNDVSFDLENMLLDEMEFDEFLDSI